MCLRPSVPSESNSRSLEVESLNKKLANKAEVNAGLEGILSFVDAEGVNAEPFGISLLSSALVALADKVRSELMQNCVES